MRIKDEVHSNLAEILTTEKPGAEDFEQAVNSFIRYHNLKQTRKTTTYWYI